MERVMKASEDTGMGLGFPLEKSHRYIRRWRLNDGNWKYEYPKEYKGMAKKDVVTSIANKTKEIAGISPITDKSQVYVEYERLRKLSSEGKLRCKALGNKNILVEEGTLDHAKKTKGTVRSEEEMMHKLQYLPYVEEVLKNGVLFMKSRRYSHSWKLDKVPERERTTYSILSKVSYFDKKKGNTVTVGLEVVVAWDSDRKLFVFSFIDQKIKKSLPFDSDISATFWASQAGACETEALSAAESIVVHKISPVKSCAQRVREILQG